MRLPAIVVALVLSASPAVAQPANSCADPYWRSSLRCQFFPTQTPQPETTSPAPPANNIPKFTRVWLNANPQIRCMDGTMPLMYVDKAVCTQPAGCGSGIRYGEPVDSNRWMFTMPGGGSCHVEYCGEFYGDPSERGEMSSVGKPEMKNMEGIHDPDPARNPVFAGYNRVRVEKCSFDRYIGRESAERDGGYFQGTRRDGVPIRYNLYYHGALMVEEAFRVLEKGLEYSTWQSREGRAVTARETLPPLAGADVVLIVGHSGANHGLYHNIDNLAAALGRMAGFKGDVRAVLDANFLPSVENEAAFATTAPSGSDAYSGVVSGTSSTTLSGVFSYDGKSHYETSFHKQQYDAWAAQLDTSCLDAHNATGDVWKCRDRHHVLLNHISTPFLQREDLLDPNVEHLDGPRGHVLQWAENAVYPSCTDGAPCDPRVDAAGYRARLEKQAQAMIDSAATRSELARGVDRSGAVPTFYLWLPACQQHEGVYGDPSFFHVKLGSHTMRQWLEDFLRAPRTGVRAWQIDGLANSAGTVVRSQCKATAQGKRRSVKP